MTSKIYIETLEIRTNFKHLFRFNFLFLNLYGRKTRFNDFCIILDICVKCRVEK